MGMALLSCYHTTLARRYSAVKRLFRLMVYLLHHLIKLCDLAMEEACDHIYEPTLFHLVVPDCM